MILMIRSAAVLALLLVGACALSTATVFAQESVGALALEHERRAPAVLPLPPASEVEKDAAQAAEEIEARKQADHRIGENAADPSRRPDLDPDVTQGVQSRGLHDILHR
jgi:hypothetical protein